jgi:periplasmic protein CpxP/Spy
MKRRIFAALLTSGLILPLSVSATQANSLTNNIQESVSTMNQFAQNHAPHAKRVGRGGGMKKMLEQLNLTPEQSQQIETIETESRTKNDTLHQEKQAIHEEMRSLLGSDASVEQLREQHQKIQAIHQQLDDNRFETMLQVREVLTPEQRNQMAELMAEKSERNR